MMSDSSKGYSLFKQCAPIFIQLVARYPHFWSQNSNISIFSALHSSYYEVRRFVFYDTMAALLFGTPSLLRYDTTSNSVKPADKRILESVYGCPREITILLAEINTWRAAQWISHDRTGALEWREIETRLRRWNPDIESVDESSNLVARLAIQEGWRQASLIYLYMVSSISVVKSLVCS